MANPISNDKILPQTADRALQKRPQGQQTEQQKAAPPAEDTVQLSHAGRLANQELDTPKGSGNITNPDQARSVASKIREQIEADGPAAGNIHRRMESGLLNNLLETARA